MNTVLVTNRDLKRRVVMQRQYNFQLNQSAEFSLSGTYSFPGDVTTIILQIGVSGHLSLRCNSARAVFRCGKLQSSAPTPVPQGATIVLGGISLRYLQPLLKSAEDCVTESTDTCRICLCPGSATEKLCSPCACAGSTKYIHKQCLQRWIMSRSQTKEYGSCFTLPRAAFVCEICKRSYMEKVIDIHTFFNYPELEGNWAVLENVQRKSYTFVRLSPFGVNIGTEATPLLVKFANGGLTVESPQNPDALYVSAGEEISLTRCPAIVLRAQQHIIEVRVARRWNGPSANSN